MLLLVGWISGKLTFKMNRRKPTDRAVRCECYIPIFFSKTSFFSVRRTIGGRKSLPKSRIVRLFSK